MGMNIYTTKNEAKHVGKRSAAGVWCWDCKISLGAEKRFYCKEHKLELKATPDIFARFCPKCKQKVEEVTLAGSKYPDWLEYKYWFECSSCGKERCSDEIGFNPAFRELGFDTEASRKRTGIDGGSRFTWAIGKDGLGDTKEEVLKAIKKRKYIWTEYGDKWTPKDFEEMLLDVIEESELDSPGFC